MRMQRSDWHGWMEEGGGGRQTPTQTPTHATNQFTPHPLSSQEGLKPTVINFNALMAACGRVGDARAARGFFEQLQVGGG